MWPYYEKFFNGHCLIIVMVASGEMICLERQECPCDETKLNIRNSSSDNNNNNVDNSLKLMNGVSVANDGGRVQYSLDHFKPFASIKDKLMTFRDSKDDLTDKIDFIICLGGDGTLLYASQLFQQSVPPVMAFHLGSLGFLTPFRFDNFQEQVNNVLEGNAALTLRSRLRCIVLKKPDQNTSSDKPKGPQVPTNLLVLNEVVVDRGPSPYLSNIDLFLDGKYITSVQGDGLIVSTPTGSTAYAVAAGASMIHPSVPAIMVTPICPHSLSFRPIVVPAGVELKITVSPESRNTAWVSFDGRNRQELCHGDSLRVTTSIYPVPSICAQDQISDWFDSLATCLHWNVRKRQRNLDDDSQINSLTHSTSDDDILDSLEREVLDKEEQIANVV
ncbi:unnamed protein product [Callosobruchus maculatus]|uniref:NAD(+) kinase n=1 Tax=Callosobruchus maculatus TaxID=64391 RepID=A0A653CCP4_CALMS|nr:unnamed protein product [Callosobruchus maculatus]